MTSPTPLPDLAALRAQLNLCLGRDRHALGRKLDYAAKRPDALNDIAQRITASIAKRAARLQARPTVTFDDTLPVHAAIAELSQAITDHQVVIVCGETGSGKTTQLPKLCLALGRGVAGLIGHTQPRRIAARSVATRIAQELGSTIGQAVGYQVRFHENTSANGYIKLMTDGILLAETQGDRFLSSYDTLIIDEAHERSLNIDFLLGYLKQLLPRRPDLKVIITSATIDADRFSKHFMGAPVIEVSGRTFPVEVRYRPLLDDHGRPAGSTDEDKREVDMEMAIVDACHELAHVGPGDILVFLPGEREIRDTAEKLRKHPVPHTEILPLYARLSHEDQLRVFASHTGRRIVLATNVAETSLTVPGIRYVVDSGLARMNRYSPRVKIEQLLIEPISQAAARQRAGRCGRVAAGVCIRLYSEADFNLRPAFTDPEILRSNLASVILRMSALKLGSVDAFPFLEAPSSRLIHDGYQVLQELGAVDDTRAITPLGTRLAKLPVDPKIGRMLLAAESEHCVSEMLVITSGLSMADPRERPQEAREAATQKHAQFSDEKSDFISLLKLWDWFEDALKHKESNKKLVQRCHDYFLSHLRLREWRELHGQLAGITAELGIKPNTAPASFEQIHKALITGLIGNIGFLSEQGDYLSARGSRFLLGANSGVRKGKPKWVLAAELTDTGKLYARTIAKIEPEWVEKVAKHLTKSHYFDPHWARASRQVSASEKVTLFGLTLIPRRPVHYGGVAPVEARQIFIRDALASFDYDTNAPWFQHNRALIAEVEELEHRARRQDVLVNADALIDFFNQKLPADIVGGISFEAWRKRAEQLDPHLLFLAKAQLMQRVAEDVTPTLYPEQLTVAGHTFSLRYRFEPGHVLDGVSVSIPLALLNTLSAAPFDWLVPGLLREKISWLIKSLPKSIRRLCVPVPDTVTALLERLPAMSAQHLHLQLGEVLSQHIQTPITPSDWALADLPYHLTMHFVVIDEAGQELASGRDWAKLQRELGQAAQLTFRQNIRHSTPQAAAPGHTATLAHPPKRAEAATPFAEQENLVDWHCGDLPEQLIFHRGGVNVTAYPALIDMGDSVALMLLDTEDEARRMHHAGVRRLLQIVLKDQLKQWQKMVQQSSSPQGSKPQGWTPLALQLRNLMSPDALFENVLACVIDRAFLGEDTPPRTQAQFNEQKARARTRLPAVTQSILKILAEIATLYSTLMPKLEKPDPSIRALVPALRTQLQGLIYPGFLTATPWHQLAHLPRYLNGLRLRLEKYPGAKDRDTRHASTLSSLRNKYTARQQKNQALHRQEAWLDEFHWMLEELAISLFAQELRTPMPVSIKRLEKYWETHAEA